MRKLIISFIALSGLFSGCQPKPSDGDLVRNMLVLTSNYIPTTNYSSYSTYSLSMDTVSYFFNQDPDPKDTLQCFSCTGNNHQLGDYPRVITDQIKLRLDAKFTHVGAKQNPDLKVYVVIIENYNLYQSYSYYPYGYGFGGYYGGYGYYGGGYIPTVSATDVADLYIQIYDLKNKTGSNPTALWGCVISDLVASSGDLVNVTQRSIDQAFAQSTYLTN